MRFLSRRHTSGPYQQFSKGLRAILGARVYEYLKPEQKFDSKPFIRTMDLPKGITLVGNAGAESGVGTGLRSLKMAIEKAGIPCSIIDLKIAHGRQSATDGIGECLSTAVFVGGLDELPRLMEQAKLKKIRATKFVAYVSWELSTVPDCYKQILERFDELWVPSEFIARAMKSSVKIPVRVIPHVIDISSNMPRKKDDDAFLFFTSFDHYSYAERKNPAAVIRAFINAFGNDETKRLLVRSSHASAFKKEHAQILSLVKGYSNIRVIDEYTSREQLLGLLATCDCFVSLHRSEGFGLMIAEALALGVPVIATDYGGSTEFLNAMNGFPIPWEPITIKHNIGPYDAGSVWAEPSHDAAVAAMKKVATTKSPRIPLDIFSSKNIGALVKQAFTELN